MKTLKVGRLHAAESKWHDLLRIFLLLQVLFGHLAAIALPTIPELLGRGGAELYAAITFRALWRFGSQAAYLFVFLSGFMVAGSLINALRMENFPSFQTFMRKRLRRIAPVAFGALLITTAFDSWAKLDSAAVQLYSDGFAYDMVAASSLSTFLGNVIFLEPIFVDSYGSNGPLWTLGYIVQYYVLGWLLFRTWKVHPWLGLTCATFAVVCMFAVRPEWSILFVAWLAGGFSRFVNSPRASRPYLLLFAFGIFVGSNLVPPLYSAALSAVVGLLTVQGLAHLPMPPRLLSTDSLRALSNHSYTVYAIHFPIFVAVYARPFEGHVQADFTFVAYSLVSLSLVLVVSLGLIWMLELRPFGLLKRYRKRV